MGAGPFDPQGSPKLFIGATADRAGRLQRTVIRANVMKEPFQQRPGDRVNGDWGMACAGLSRANCRHVTTATGPSSSRSGHAVAGEYTGSDLPYPNGALAR